MAANFPFSGSKNSVETFSQPPRSAIVNRSGTAGNLSLFCFSTDSTTGR